MAEPTMADLQRENAELRETVEKLGAEPGREKRPLYEHMLDMSNMIHHAISASGRKAPGDLLALTDEITRIMRQYHNHPAMKVMF